MRLHATKLGSIANSRGFGDQLFDLAGQVPNLDLNFAGTKTLDPRITFTRASTGTYVGGNGTLRTAVTNLLLRSEEFNDAQWVKVRSSVTANAATSPSGAVTADKIVEDTSANTHIIQLQGSAAVNSGTTYTYSWYFKKAERTAIRVTFGNDASVFANQTLDLDLTTGSLTSVSGFSIAPVALSLGNDWWRLSATVTALASALPTIRGFLIAGGLTNYTGDGTSGLYLWGAQLEQSSTAGEYIPTTSTINSAPRFDHAITSSRTNHITNNTMVGAVAGTPGTLPTNWPFQFSNNGLAVSIVGTGTESGIAYLDWRVSGTATAAAIGDINFGRGSALTAQTWTASSYLRLVAGNLSGVTSATIGLIEETAAPAFVTGATYSISLPTTASLITQRPTASRTLTGGATVALLRTGLTFNVSSGSTVDFTIRIGMPQLEQGSVATSVIPTSTAAVTDNTTESLGLLVEEARTNSVTNNTMVGAVAGTPGTLPTSWGTYVAPTGLTRTIVGSGIVNGINYIDVRFNGTPSSTSEITLYLSPATTATLAQAWTSTAWLSLAGGSTSNIGGISLRNFELNSGAYVREINTNFVSSISSDFVRRQNITTSFGASANQIQLALAIFATAAGTPIDITIRIGLPQLEQGAFATSVIATSTATATRAADVASITGTNFSSWYNQTEGTVFTQFRPLSTSTIAIAGFDDGTNDNRWRLGRVSSGEAQQIVQVSGINQVTTVISSLALNGLASTAATVRLNDCSLTTAGLIPLDDTSCTIPTVNKMTIGSAQVLTAAGSTIRRLAYWPVRLPNATLQAITAS